RSTRARLGDNAYGEGIRNPGHLVPECGHLFHGILSFGNRQDEATLQQTGIPPLISSKCGGAGTEIIPSSAKLKKPLSETITWSSTAISSISPATTSFLVSWISALLGLVFPDGWL